MQAKSKTMMITSLLVALREWVGNDRSVYLPKKPIQQIFFPQACKVLPGSSLLHLLCKPRQRRKNILAIPESFPRIHFDHV
jgi:hypothetical protein